MKNEIRFTLEPKQRPKLAQKFGKILGTAPHYERVPSCAWKTAFCIQLETGTYGQISQGQETMPVSQGVGKAGKHRFRFACEYRRRTDDSL